MRSAWHKTRGTRGGRVALLVLGGVLLAPINALAGRITLAWDPSPDPVAGYTIYWSTSPGNYTCPVNTTCSVSTTQTTHTIHGLINGVRYYFIVKAFSSGGLYSSASNEVNGLPSNLPPSITNPGDRTVRAGLFSLAISASDPDGDSLAYSATGLPSGLSIHSSTGVISGTVAAGVYTITVTVTDGAAQASATFVLTVTANNIPTLQTPADQSNDTDDAVSLQLAASDADGDTLTFSSTGLPPGLALDTATGLITGIPTTVGDFTVSVTVSDGADSTSRSFSWTVVPLPPPVPISRWNFDEGSGTSAADTAGSRTGTLTNGAAWRAGHSGSAVLLDGVNDYVAIPAFDVSGSAMTIAGWIMSSSFSTSDQRFISKTTGTTNYWTLGTNGSALRFRLRTGTSTTTLDGGTLQPNTWYHAVATYDGAMMRLYLNGVQVGSAAKTGAIATGASVPAGIGRNPDGSGSNYVQGAIDDLRIFTRGLTAAEVTTLFTEPAVPPVNQPPVITNPGDTTIRTGPFSLTISASDPEGDTLTWSASGLPSSLSINASTGTITGTVAAGTYTITVTAGDGDAQDSEAFILTVTPNSSPTLQAPPDQNHDTDDVVSLQLSASDPDGDPLTFSATGLPPGVTVNTATGLISGTPTTAGSYPVTVGVTDGALSVGSSFNWTVVALPVVAPASHWTLDEGAGTTAADIAGARTGTLTNGAAWTAGRSGNAVTLDGVNDYVALPAFDVSGSAITLAGWIRNSSFTAGVDQRFISKATGTSEQAHYWMLGQTISSGAPRLRFRLRTGTSTTTLIASSGNLPLNTWYHAVATYDGATMRLYLNGVQVGSLAKAGVIPTSASVPVSIGRSPEGSNYLHGAIDDMRIFARALTASEVTALFNEPPDPSANQAPVLTNPGNQSHDTDDVVNLQLVASDPDGDLLTFSAAGLPPGLAINQATGLITGVPTTVGSYPVTVGVTDGALPVSATFSWTIVAPGSSGFTDDPLIPGVHVMRLVHLTEMRTRIDALRVVRGLTSMPWTSLVAGSTVIRASHITELRTALAAIYASMGRPAAAYTDTQLTAGMPIKAAHVSELRAAIRAVE